MRPSATEFDFATRTRTSARSLLQSPWFVVIALTTLAVCGPLLAPYDPNAISLSNSAHSTMPSAVHWLGTDALGRDITSRLLAGSRYTLGVATAATLIAAFLGVIVGSLSAFAGGAVDRVLMRSVDVLLSIPRLLLLLAVVGAWGRPSTMLLVVVLGTTGWFGLSRLVRAAIRRELAEGYATASRALGASVWEFSRQHVLPAVRPLVLVWMSTAFSGLILLETGLSFLGLGVQAPEASWGTVLLEAGDVFGQARWLVLGPGLLIGAVVAVVQRVADAAQVTKSAQPL